MPTPTWKLIQNLADQAAPQVQQTFLKSIANTQSGMSMSGLQSALAKGNFDAAWKAIRWERVMQEELTPELARTLSRLVGSAGATGLDALLKGQGGPRIDFTADNPFVYDFVKKQTGDLITNVTAQTKQGVKWAVSQAFQDGLKVPSQRIFTLLEHAANIRESLGLNIRQMQALQAFRASLRTKGIVGPAYSGAVEKYKTSLLKARAATIARTETITAANAAQDLALQSAFRDGSMDPKLWELEWLVTPDDVTCKHCMSMNKKRRPIGGVYTAGYGAGRKGPTLHPSCRCTEVPVRRKGAKPGRSTQATQRPMSEISASSPMPGLGTEAGVSEEALAAESVLGETMATAESTVYESPSIQQLQQAIEDIQAGIGQAIPGQRTFKDADRELREQLKKIRAHKEVMKQVEARGGDISAMKTQLQEMRKVKVNLQNEKRILKAGKVQPKPPIQPQIQPPKPPIQPLGARTYRDADRELREQLTKIRAHKAKMSEFIHGDARFVSQANAKMSSEYKAMERELAEMRKVKVALQQEKRILKAGGVVPPKLPPVKPPVAGPPLPELPPGFPPLNLASKEAPRILPLPPGSKTYVQTFSVDNIAYAEGVVELLEKGILENEKILARMLATKNPDARFMMQDIADNKFLIEEYKAQITYLKALRQVIPAHGLDLAKLKPTTKFGQEIRDMAKIVKDKDDIESMRKIGTRVRQEIETRIQQTKREAARITDKFMRRIPLDPGETWDMVRQKYYATNVDIESRMWRRMIKEVVGEVRSMGGAIDADISATEAFIRQSGAAGAEDELGRLTANLREVAELYPTDWIEQFNTSEGRRLRIKMCARDEPGMEGAGGQYSDYIKMLETKFTDHTVLAHEYAHGVEGVRLKTAARKFLKMRARGAGQEVVWGSSIKGQRVMGWKDRFFDSYCGTYYADNATEILSRGYETLFWDSPGKFKYFGTAEPDNEYVDFLLGLLGVM